MKNLPYTAETDIEGYRLVTFGTNDGEVKPTTAKTDPVIGVTNYIGAPKGTTVDCGDNVIIINADKVVLTGNKWNDRIYLRYTGYPGGQIEYTPADLLKKGGDRLFRKVVKGMLPKNRLGAKLLNNMYVYEGTEHKHEAQQPKLIDINSYK